MDGDKRTGLLEPNGKLTTFDGGNETYNSFRDYANDVLGEVIPTKATEEEILTILSIGLGEYTVVQQETPNETPAAAKKRLADKEKEDKIAMKNATKAPAPTKAAAPAPTKQAKPAPEAKAPKVKAEKVVNDCTCGCGNKTGGLFAPGHDARVHGWGKKIDRGEMTFKQLTEEGRLEAVKWLKASGHTQGVAPKPAPKVTPAKAAK